MLIFSPWDTHLLECIKCGRAQRPRQIADFEPVYLYHMGGFYNASGIRPYCGPCERELIVNKILSEQAEDYILNGEPDNGIDGLLADYVG